MNVRIITGLAVVAVLVLITTVWASSRMMAKDQGCAECRGDNDYYIEKVMKMAKKQRKKFCIELNDPEDLMGWWCISFSDLKPDKN